jgi:hypothetical protein
MSAAPVYTVLYADVLIICQAEGDEAKLLIWDPQSGAAALKVLFFRGGVARSNDGNVSLCQALLPLC